MGKDNEFKNFYTLEGGEGAGKSSTALLIKKELEAKGYKVLLTREPGGEKIAEKIRNIILNNKISKKTEVLLFAAARIEHLEQKIIPALRNGEIVISDRYVDSSIVYQGIVGGISEVEEINKFAIGNKLPNTTFIFDIDPEIALNRIKANNRIENRFDKENLEFHKQIREGYLEIGKTSKRYKVIDANKTVIELTEEITSKIIKNLET